MVNENVKRCSTSLTIREMQIKTSYNSEWPSSKKSANSKCWRWCGEKEPGCTVCGDVNWHSLYGKQYGDAFKKLAINLVLTQQPLDPSIPLLGIYLEKTTVLKVTGTPMFIAAQFTKARIWKQPRCPLTTRWIKKPWYIYTMEYYSAIKRNEFESVVVR